MVKILKHFGWTWVGLLVSDDDYGLHVAQSFQSDLARSGDGCLAYLKVLPWNSDQSELTQIVHLIKASTARVVIVFAHEIHMIQLMEEVNQTNNNIVFVFFGLVASKNNMFLFLRKNRNQIHFLFILFNCKA